MKVAIVGSSGYISSFLIKQFNELKSITEIKRIDKVGDIDWYLDLEKPEEFDYSNLETIDFVVFTAAISGPDMCAKEFDKCWKINVEGTGYFINKAIEIGCKVLFFSSDAVFGDDIGSSFDELSPTKANTAYGKMKKAVEDKFKDNPYFKAIRLSYVVSAKDRFTTYCLSCVREHKVAEVFHPFYRNCITVHDVLDSVCWLLCNWEKLTSFALNIAGLELVSRVRIADEINRCINNKLQYDVKLPDKIFFENRPKITQMKSLYLYDYAIIENRNFTQKMKIELENVEL